MLRGVGLSFGIFAACMLAPAQPPGERINVSPKHFSTDKSVRIDYDLIYVRAPRKGDAVGTNWAEIANPTYMDAGADLMLLHPDGSEEVLVEGGIGSVTDPVVSFDGNWVYYAYFHDLRNASITKSAPAGADIFKIHVKSRKKVQLTRQQFTPNLGCADWSRDFRTPERGKNYLDYGVFNMGPCPLPGGKVMFTSNANAFKPPKRLPQTLQLFVMDDDGANIECIGHLNLGMALHPAVLKDGRVMFSSLESQGLRHSILWGLWTIHPDGTNWAPMVSAFVSGPNPGAYHFQTQLSDGSIVAEEYYNQTSSGFGSFVKFPADAPDGKAPFGPGFVGDPRNPELRHGRIDSARPRVRRLPFSPFGIESLTPFARADEGQADVSVSSQRYSTRVGKVTHPSAAPDNHLLLVWSPGPVNGGYTVNQPAVNGGIYLMKGGRSIEEPGQLLLIKDDPKYNEQWPRALVPYKRIYGVDEPKHLPALANDGTRSPHLPAGTPFGLVGTSSLYKRESYPNGMVKSDSVTAAFAGGIDRTGFQDLDPFNTMENGASPNWFNQGADAGRYSNDDVHAVRILAMEPTTDRHRGPHSGATFRSHANERLRILGEIPVRKFAWGAAGASTIDGQAVDPDGNPDTSFLAKIPADTAFTFQTLDKNGMVLNMAQTWHQVRPGEIRTNCGGCHAHSQKPTLFENTVASRPSYELFDLSQRTPLLTGKAGDESRKKWDTNDETGLRFAAGVRNVEFHRDVKPILQRSCVPCHTQNADKPAGNLVLDADTLVNLPDADDVPGTYYRLAMDRAGRFGHRPLIGSWRNQNASRYVRMFQSRRSLLIWKVYGKRTDGWNNDDFPTETVPGNPQTLRHKGELIPNTAANRNRADLDFTGSIMPPPEAIAGNYKDAGGKVIKVPPLTDEDRRTLVRWIDLGCPIDLDFEPAHSQKRTYGWMLDEQRPTLTMAVPIGGKNREWHRIVIGMHDYGTGIDVSSFTVTASIAIDGAEPGANLATKFMPIAPGIWEMKFGESKSGIEHATLTVAVKDKQGNQTRIVRRFSVNGKADSNR